MRALLCILTLAAFVPFWNHIHFDSPSPQQQQVMRANNLGVAYMNQQKLDQALKEFEQAAALAKDNPAVQLNLGIALLNLQRVEPAETALHNAENAEPKNPAIWYNLGLLHRNNGDIDKALGDFTKAGELDPKDSYTQYFLGDLYLQQQKYPEAEQHFRRAIEIDPFTVSGEFGLARALQREGKTAEAKTHFQRFQKLTHDKLGSPVSQIYGEQGPLSLAKNIAGEALVPAAIPVHFAEFSSDSGLTSNVDASPTSLPEPGTGVCVYDLNGDGKPDVLLANRSGHPALLLNRGEGKFQDGTKDTGLDRIANAVSCAIGDYDNDGKPDIAFTVPSGIVLLHNEGNGKFRDATADAKIKVQPRTFAATFVDYDHDGDLDLYVTRYGAHGAKSNTLLRNNGDGTFTDVTSETGLGNAGSASVVASDINNDRAVDLVLAGPTSPEVYLNPREGEFHPMSGLPAGPGPLHGVVALDYDKDGRMDLAFTASDGLHLWHNVDGKKFEPVALPKANWKNAWGIAAFDFDNDGWIDLAVVGDTDYGAAIQLLRNLGPKGFQDVTSTVGLDKIKLNEPRALVAADLDGDGDSDLLITQRDSSVVALRNDGGNRNHSLRVSLKGLNDNKSAFGTKVQVFAGELQQKWEVAGSSGYLAQGPDEILAGLGQRTNADVLRLLWPTGVYQDEIDLAANEPHDVLEIDRRGSSCPVLFAWNGTTYKMISDVIGAAVIGHWVAPHERDLPDPDEYIKVDGSRVQPRDGMLSFTFAEPMEEVNYLDQARLVAVDHPANVDIYPNERFVANPPFPKFKIVTARAPHPPAGAWDDHGNNVLPALLAHDHHYVTGFKLLRFAGFAEPHSLILDLGKWDSARPLYLLLDGFTEYFTANSMYAASQANLSVMAPYLEAQQPDGTWKRVIDDMGFPAGLPRTITVDLTGKIAPGTRKVRIVTNLQIYWDKALIDNSIPETVQTHEVPLANARLHFHGYPKADESRFPGDLDYNYNDVSLTGPYARHIGIYTRYGDVTPLLKSADDRYVIFGSGEEVVMNFDVTKLPPPPTGWTRDYLFYANGFVKDMDFYEADAFTVGPLPYHGMGTYPHAPNKEYPLTSQSLNYLLDYDTRYQSGAGVTAYKYDYSEK